MKQFILAATVAAITLATPAYAADVGVSVSVGEPGFYGRIDIGNFPPPQVIYRHPVVVERVVVGRPPVYLRVPRGHAKHWKKHCREYNACNEQVYFVQDNWYNREYVPHYREQQRDRNEGRRDDRRDDRRDESGGNGRGKGEHHGKGHGRDH